MQDLSLHILDIVENSITAGATLVKVAISENMKSDSLVIRIEDNGCGMDKERLKKALDPFYTTSKSRRVGLGLSMFAQATKEAGGDFKIKSRIGKGTIVTATFSYAHIDRKPIGNMVETLIALIATNGLNVDFYYKHKKNGRSYVFDTRQFKKELDGVTINHPEVLNFLKKEIMDGLNKINEIRSET